MCRKWWDTNTAKLETMVVLLVASSSTRLQVQHLVPVQPTNYWSTSTIVLEFQEILKEMFTKQICLLNRTSLQFTVPGSTIPHHCSTCYLVLPVRIIA